jgi:hypothetical protein
VKRNALGSRKNGLLSFLPNIQKCDRLQLRDGDILITVGGFEERRLAASQMTIGPSTGDAILIRYETEDPRNNEEQIISELRRKGIAVDENRIIAYNRFAPQPFSALLRERLESLEARAAVVDVSAMSKLCLLLCIDVCREMNLDTSVFYAEAATYGPTQEAYNMAKADLAKNLPSLQIYTGVHGFVRVAQLSSVAMQGQPTAAIAFMSFNEQLTQALLNSVYPSRLFLINGRPPKFKWREEAMAWIHEQLRREWPERDNPVDAKGLPKRSTSTLHYQETVQTLLALYWILAVDHRILLTPAGSKMQAVGVYIAKALHPDIHIEYPTPKGFLDPYSTGIGSKWIIRFGPLEDLVRLLRHKEREERLSFTQRINLDRGKRL